MTHVLFFCCPLSLSTGVIFYIASDGVAFALCQEAPQQLMKYARFDDSYCQRDKLLTFVLQLCRRKRLICAITLQDNDMYLTNAYI